MVHRRFSARLGLALIATGLASVGCEGCPLFAPVPECNADEDCPEEGAICEDGVCLAPGDLDAGALEPDAGVTDSGPRDAGEVDSGIVDAGVFDAGEPEDAGVVDAGLPDAGSVDAGAVDAGEKDAGPFDAGPEERECLSSRDCDFDRLCSDLRDEGNEVVPYCRGEAAGNGLIGDLCVAQGDCLSGFCTPRGKVCSEACEDAEIDCGVGTACTAYPFGATDGFNYLSVCVLACDRDADCPAERFCTYNGNPSTNVFDSVCEEAAGPGGLGDPCNAATDCASGLCLAEGCTRACVDANDCVGGAIGNPMNACVDVTVADPNDTGTPQTLQMCR